MKKFYSFLLAAVALVGFAACNQDFTADIAPESGEMVSFKATIADETRVGLDGLQTVWEADDKVMVDGYTFICQSDLETFVCNEVGCSELVEEGRTVEAVYAGKFDLSGEGVIDSTKGTAGAVLKAEGSLTEGTLSFQIQSAFLKFTTSSNVVLNTANGDELFSELPLSVNELTADKDGVYYVAINPVSATLSYSIDDVECKKITKTFEAGKIYNLGFLGKKSEYGVVGSFQTPTTWDVAAPVAMYEISGGWAVAKGVELYLSDEFKIVTGNSWDNPNYGLKDAAGVVAENTEVALTKGGQNIKVAKNGKFDIYFKADGTAFKYECVEEYTDLKVNITINNKANWSPLTMTLKDGDNVIANKATVTGNKFPVSGEYIGKTLSCQFFSGSKQSEVMNVSITKTGAAVTLEEIVIKLKVQLTTANAKQWWGNTMKIYVWGSGTSLDTSWPGTTMTSEGNYTWSIIVPSELVGKKINYVINNGGDWKSNDSAVTIDAKGNTINAKDIGIN